MLPNSQTSRSCGFCPTGEAVSKGVLHQVRTGMDHMWPGSGQHLGVLTVDTLYLAIPANPWPLLSPFSNKKTEAHRGYIPGLRLPTCQGSEAEFEPRLPGRREPLGCPTPNPCLTSPAWWGG